MTLLHAAILLLASASTLSASSHVYAIVDKGIATDLSSVDFALVDTAKEFNTEEETLLDGYLHRHSYPSTSSVCEGLIVITTVKLNQCRKLDYRSSEMTVATSTLITKTTYSDSDCVTAASFIKKSYTAGVCNSQIFYSISQKVTSDLTVPRVTKRSAYSHRYRYKCDFRELIIQAFYLSYYELYDCSGSPIAGDTYLLDTCAEGVKYSYSGMDM